MLSTILQDPDLENRRLGLTTFTSAAHNKPDLVLGHLKELMPSVLDESKVKPELIREVMMGPFKIMVDDGLELRKVRTDYKQAPVVRTWLIADHRRVRMSPCMRSWRWRCQESA